MRMEGWSKLGYYPTPDRVTDIIAANFPAIEGKWNRGRNRHETRVMDPCCGEGNAAARFVNHLKRASSFVDQVRSHPDSEILAYGIELDRDRANAARRKFHQVWNADIDNTLIRENTYNALWLNPPYDWSDDEDDDGSRRLESRFLKKATQGLAGNGYLIYIIPQHVLAWDARYLLRNYTDVTVGRFPDPEYDVYKQVVVIARRRTNTASRPSPEQIKELESLARVGGSLEPISIDHGRLPISYNPYGSGAFPAREPARILRYNPEEMVQHMAETGAWEIREVKEILSTEIDPVRLRPIEPLPEGHAAMVAANSMMDNILIRHPSEDLPPIVIRGFFRKVRKETFRTDNVIKQTDFFESNIRALDVATGEIEEVGSSPELLRAFMEKHGLAIRGHIADAYPPSVDLESPRARVVKERVGKVARPLLGKQVDAAVVGAAYLSRHKHLNLFATQGSGKTCTATAIARGMDAAKVAVVTPARVVPNWIDEIKAMCPNAIVRVVQDQNPIGTRRDQRQGADFPRPEQVGRASLEEIRSLEPWATPEAPLWVIFKKDSCRGSYPVSQGLRMIGGKPEAKPFRPLEHVIEAERRQVLRRPGSQKKPQVRRLYRSEDGTLDVLPLDIEGDDGHRKPMEIVGTCPKCWFPLTDDEKWTGRDRNSMCLNPYAVPRYPGPYDGTEDSDQDVEIETSTCREPIGTAVRTDTGRAVFSYGDYAARYMNRFFDLFIVDEAQDYKAKDTAQGQTVRRMAQRMKKTLFLTGTPFGGKVSEVFYTLLASDPAFSKEFHYRELKAFKRAYGREEITIETEDEGQSVGARSKRRESRQVSKEIPGYHPALLEHFWHNTIFMSLRDVDVRGDLPAFSQFAELIRMDETEQAITASGATQAISQYDGYHTLDAEMSETMKKELQLGKRTLLGAYLHETLCYPENCWQGAEPRDSYGSLIVRIPPLDADRLYPKEEKLLSILAEQKAAGRKCLIYCTHTQKRDTTARLSRILNEHGFRALQLKSSTVKSEQRTSWLQHEADRNDVIITQPRLVETGVNLLEYPTIIWYEIEYSMFTNEQASARSYRITQRQPVEVYYLAYAGTMQERALRIIARKADVSRTFHGDLSKNGLSAFNPEQDDIREQLARELLTKDGGRSKRNGYRPAVSIVFTNHPGGLAKRYGVSKKAARKTLVAAPEPTSVIELSPSNDEAVQSDMLGLMFG